MEWIILISFLLMLAGMAGVIFPFLPGVPLAWLGLFVYAYKTGFTDISAQPLWIFGILTLFTFLIDFISPMLSARIQHASRSGVQGAFWGSVLGVIIFGPIGIFIGPLLGSFLGELFAGGHPRQSIKVALGTMAGFLVGSAIKVIVILSMMIYLMLKLIF